jgi:hypothetical protein
MSNNNNNGFGGFGGFGGTPGGGAGAPSGGSSSPPPPAGGGFGGFGGFGGAPADGGASPTGRAGQAPPPVPGAAPRAVTTNTQGRQVRTKEPGDGDMRFLKAKSGNLVLVTGLEQKEEILTNDGECAIDGVCAFNYQGSTRDEAAPPKVVIWQYRGGGAVQAANLQGLSAQSITKSTQNDYEIFTHLGFHVRVPPSLARIVVVDDLFSPKALVLHGDDGRTVAADLPMAAEWRPYVRLCTARWDGGALEYRVELHGLSGPLTRRYTSAEIAEAGVPPNSGGLDHLRIMAWPKNAPARWRLFVVDVGTPPNPWLWNGQFKWGLYTWSSVASTGRPGDDRRLFPCRSLKGGAELLGLQNGTSRVGFEPDLPLRVATSERPNFIEIRSVAEDAVGTLSLLDSPDPSLESSGGGQAEQWAVDIGTSNSCLARLLPGSARQTQVMNFNQVFAPSGPEDDDSGLVECRIGDKKEPRSVLHWMPGLRSPSTLESSTGKDPILQVPSRLALLVPGRRPDAMDAAEIRSLIPMCDAVIPPLQTEHFGKPKVDDSTVDRLKWVDKHDTRRVALLEQYIASVLIMAAARARPTSSVSVQFSQPLAFTEQEKAGLVEAARNAAATATRLTGTPIEARVDSDESHCILEQFAKLKPIAGAYQQLWVLCDIGGGSVDIAVATGNVDSNITDLAVLAADSIRFGANLVFNNILERAGNQVAPGGASAEHRRRVAREAIALGGYDVLLARCNPGTKAEIQRIVQLYFELLAEYMARTVAGCIRNPKRMKGVLKDSYKWDIAAPEDLTTNMVLMVTGNGFRTFEVLGKAERQMLEFTERVKSRVTALVQAPMPFDKSKSVSGGDDDWYANVPPFLAQGSLGLKPGDGATYLKEALAYSILRGASEARGGEQRDAMDYLAAPNGLTEYQAPFPGRNVRGSERPWFAFVGAATQIKRTDGTSFPVDRAEPWFITDPTMKRDEKFFGPAFPAQALDLARELRWNLDFNTLCVQQASPIANALKPESHKTERQSSLLKAVYEEAVSRLFSDKDFLR